MPRPSFIIVINRACFIFLYNPIPNRVFSFVQVKGGVVPATTFKIKTPRLLFPI